MAPKDYHSVIRVSSVGGKICAEVYCQTQKEAVSELNKIEDCMNGIGPSVINIGDSVVRGTAIEYAQAYSKADYPPYSHPEEPGKTNKE